MNLIKLEADDAKCSPICNVVLDPTARCFVQSADAILNSKKTFTFHRF